VLLGRALVDKFPNLPADLADLGHVGVLSSNRLGYRTSVEVAEFAPDLVVGGPAMVDAAFLFRSYLLQSGFGGVSVVVADTNPSASLKVRVAHAGFQDVVDLGRPVAEVLDSLRCAGAGEFALDTDPMWTNINRPTRSADVELAIHDPMDVEILELIAIGLSDSEIAGVVYMSPQTVRNRVSQMLIHSGLSNRTQLAWIFTHQNLLKRISLGIDRRPRPS